VNHPAVKNEKPFRLVKTSAQKQQRWIPVEEVWRN